MIYLDYAAATPVSPPVLAAMMPYFTEQFFNPSAPYLPARQVRQAYQQAKDDLAHTIGAKGADLVITSGATESINLAFTVLDTAKTESAPSPVPPEPTSLKGPSSTRAEVDTPPSALILTTEHAAVRATAARYPHDTIKVNRVGLIDLADFQAKLTPSVSLVSISLVNNELGTIQPLAEVAGIIAAERTRRLQQGNPTPLYLHSDASQALALLDISVARLGVDMLTLNSGKIYGPKGVGALYLAHRVRLRPITYGGGQERGLRSGTENVPGMIGFATAATLAKQHLKFQRARQFQLSRILATELAASPIPPLFLGHSRHRLANFLPVSFPGVDAERLIYLLEEQGILLSTGAACAASKGQPSHVLTAIGLSPAEIAGSLRISLGQDNTEEDMHVAGRAIVAAVRQEVERTTPNKTAKSPSTIK